MGAARENAFERMRPTWHRFLGHADRVRPFEDYCVGLLWAEGRKSVEPLAAVTAPERTAAQHQSLLHLVAQAPWSDQAVLTRVRERVLRSITSKEPIQAWIIDDTGFPKQGRHSVGVARQYCGQLGKQDNCQVAVSVSLANEQYSLPVAYRLYLPKEWAEDPLRRAEAKVPETVAFATKPALALQLLEQLQSVDGLPKVVVVDAGYGVDTAFRQSSPLWGSATWSVSLAVSVWPEGKAPLPPKPWVGRGLKPTRLRRDAEHQPLSVRALAMQLPTRRFHTVTWREGTHEALSSRFAALRVRCAHRDHMRTEPHPEQWLLIEWPRDEAEPTKYFLSSLPAATALKELVRVAKLRWRIERDYQELKQELGLGHFEGRSWRGFHHHATLCIAASGFLISEREATPPHDLPAPGDARNLPFPQVTDPEDPPLRSQRHMPNSIATLRIRLARTLMLVLPRCPCCGRPR